MENETVTLNGYIIRGYSVNTLIIGSGAASLNAALSLHSAGQRNILIATEKWGGGTTRNAGSDKQTYYKLSLAGDEPDSPVLMAEDLFKGRCMHGDIALCEAQGSVQAFMNLIRLGVPFPHNKYGAWVGYKTDNDPKARGTSAGPYTSRMIFEALAKEVRKRKIKVLDSVRVISLLTKKENDSKSVTGALAINLKADRMENAFILFNAKNIIMGTGGPAGLYKDSVYPESQSGSTGIALEAGATAQNLTESQFGIASTKFRWNLSGSYQQVIPRYFSTNAKGNDEREFLNEFFPDITSLTKAIFLKGYQWPFDPEKTADYGSSLIDLLVYRERVEKGRKVFIDFRTNPTGPACEKYSPEILDRKVFEYLKNSDALKETPVKRLEFLNKPAFDLYLEHNINLAKEPLEIAVCVQHNNGGLKGNIWWESDLKHLFPVGEVNGSHGVYRPGGSALNAGQTGSHRAALYIIEKYNKNPITFSDFYLSVKEQVEEKLKLARKWSESEIRIKNIQDYLNEIGQRMSETAGIVRNIEKTIRAAEEASFMFKELDEILSVKSVKELAEAFRLKEHCLTHLIYIEALKTYLEKGGRSRGSYMVTYSQGIKPHAGLEDKWRFSLCDYQKDIENKILEIQFNKNTVKTQLTDVRPIPAQELWFETVWKKYREGKITGY
ncbi:MAG TPA: FAD-binding protein [Bacteroidales bacterium]|nr:FAD-binding protein [Bacteroidales bacterium]HOU96309.1 FAD-binding protein [Bacteroidales bacterium]HQG36689.1 FAD-binding protein [Bacteroidales bacterium]HQG52168.1 FAD-binding protein [Bacteroidales bacterium]HQJ19954.1 FAD-binding protein [Bacteroidales bacterium]